MARIKDASVEAVKAAADIVALVEGYTRLRKSGSRYVGLCPFHQEKTPSFGVSPERGTFKCFGCGEEGDAPKLVMRLNGVAFPEAVRLVAELSGIVTPSGGSPRRSRKGPWPRCRPTTGRGTCASCAA